MGSRPQVSSATELRSMVIACIAFACAAVVWFLGDTWWVGIFFLLAAAVQGVRAVRLHQAKPGPHAD